MSEQFEYLLKVSDKGRIIIPKEICAKLGVRSGEELLEITKDGDILLRKAQEAAFRHITKEIEKAVKEESLHVDKMMDEEIKRARRPK